MSKICISAICLNGHVQSNWLDDTQYPDSYCRDCGKPIITECPNCKKPIRGLRDGSIPCLNEPPYLPLYCPDCGAAFPWTAHMLSEITGIIRLSEDLDESEQSELIDNIPNVVRESIATPKAAALFRKASDKLGEFMKSVLTAALCKIACESFLSLFRLSQ